MDGTLMHLVPMQIAHGRSQSTTGPAKANDDNSRRLSVVHES